MATKFNSTDVSRSRYVQGGQTERYPTRLGWWTRRTLPTSDTDIQVTIDVRTHQRPWVVAYDVYGSEELEWVVLQYNNILDVTEEFVFGRTIILPTAQRLKLEIFGNPSGGIKMTDSQ